MRPEVDFVKMYRDYGKTKHQIEQMIDRQHNRLVRENEKIRKVFTSGIPRDSLIHKILKSGFAQESLVVNGFMFIQLDPLQVKQWKVGKKEIGEALKALEKYSGAKTEIIWRKGVAGVSIFLIPKKKLFRGLK